MTKVWSEGVPGAGRFALVHALVAVVLSLALSGCGGCGSGPFDEPQVLGGVEVSAEVLNRGYRVYRYNCSACHGEAGDGEGPSSRASTPPPRDFRKGVFKFKSTAGDALPLDADLLRTVSRGLEGTTMNGFDLSEEDATAVVQYVKTFSGRWGRERPGGAVSVGADPYGPGRREAGISRGKVVYHAVAQCWSCHPAYLSGEALEALLSEADVSSVSGASVSGVRKAAWRVDLGKSVTVDTAYGKLLPPDFYGATLRAARTGADLYRTIAAGVGGTEMPAWSTELSSEDIWALVYYVRELQRLGELKRPRGR